MHIIIPIMMVIIITYLICLCGPRAHSSRTMQGALGQEDPLEEGMATHSRILAWRILGTGEPGGLPSLGSHRVGHD